MGVDMEYCKCCQECVNAEYIVKCEHCSEYIEFDGDCICDHCINDEDPAVIKSQDDNYFCGKECKKFHEKVQEKAGKLYHCDICNVDIKPSSKSSHEKTKKHKTNLKKNRRKLI